MKRLGILMALFAGAAFADNACITATLTIYDGAGFTCHEGTEDFSNFKFTASGTDVPLPGDSSISVTPLTDGFQFNAGFFVPSGETLDVTISYDVSIPTPGMLTGDSLAIGGFGQTGNGALDVAESLCIGAIFNSSGVCVPPAVSASLNVFDNSMGFKQADSDLFSTSLLGVVKDIALTGGSGGSSAQVSLIDNATPFAVAPVPEPSSLALIGTLMLGLSFALRKNRKEK